MKENIIRKRISVKDNIVCIRGRIHIGDNESLLIKGSEISLKIND